MIDPDRFFDLRRPGSQEWWYFDALSDDGRDALVLIWYAALPFDPDYGVAAVRHLDDPSRFAAPDPRDHCAVGLSWYRDGNTVAYALNGFRKGDFEHRADPFSVGIGGNRLSRDAEGYALQIDTPSVDGKRPVAASIRFRPAPGTAPHERGLGTPDSPHAWIVAAADCRVEGRVSIGDRAVDFAGRGYHDHNAGSDEMSRSMKRWEWGRVHVGPLTHVYYRAEPKVGPPSGVWITCRDGRPETIREGASFEESDGRSGNVFGMRHGRHFSVADGPDRLVDSRARCVDDGPFYRRWVGPIAPSGGPDPGPPGISELLDTRNLNRRLFNWMIPYRLKRPRGVAPAGGNPTP